MGLTGPPGPLAQAVHVLLGSDPRFHVDERGYWRLRAVEPPSHSRLETLDYAVVDVEATNAALLRDHRIIEIAIVEMRAGAVVATFHSLVNPGCPLQPWVTRVTGITDSMVRDAPSFAAIAPDVLHRLSGKIFVAHNAAFDWAVISGRLTSVLGSAPPVPVICTLRLARRLLPGLPRRNLTALATHFGIEVRDRHRAYGDADATARIFREMILQARDVGIARWDDLRRLLSGELMVPPLPGPLIIAEP